MAHKFSKLHWQEWKSNPETWWQEHNIDLSKDQQEWFKAQNATRFSYDEFRENVRKSQMFAGFFDWS